MDERKRDSMVAYLRRRMQEFGIRPDDLASAIASDQAEQKEARYRNATGNTWSGEGKMPQWLKQAISAGKSLEHFQLSSSQRDNHAKQKAYSSIGHSRQLRDRKRGPTRGTRQGTSVG